MKFVIYKDTDKKFRWRLYPDKGLPIAASAEGTSTYDECIETIEQVRRSVSAPVEDISFGPFR